MARKTCDAVDLGKARKKELDTVVLNLFIDWEEI